MPFITPTMLKNGLATSHPKIDPGQFTWYPYPDPTLMHQYWNDFDVLDLTDEWRQNFTNAAATATLIEAPDGILRLRNSAANADENMIELRQKTFQFTIDSVTDRKERRFYIYGLLAAEDWETQFISFGLMEPGLGQVGAQHAFRFVKRPGQGIRFQSLNFPTGFFASDDLFFPQPGTKVELGALLDLDDTLYVYINRKLTLKIQLTFDQIFTADELNLAIYQINQAAVASELFCDYVLAANDRQNFGGEAGFP